MSVHYIGYRATYVRGVLSLGTAAVIAAAFDRRVRINVIVLALGI